MDIERLESILNEREGETRIYCKDVFIKRKYFDENTERWVERKILLSELSVLIRDGAIMVWDLKNKEE